MPTVLVVDDVVAMAEQYAYDLKRLGGFETLVATGGGEALNVIANEDVDCVILDLEMPGVDGFQVLRTLSEKEIDVPVIVYTGAGDFDRCIQAIRLGAYGFIDKTESMARVVREVEMTLERAALKKEVSTLREKIGTDTPLIGSSKAMHDLHGLIERVAPIDSPALIVGESGTGKELVAREIHRLAFTDERPFVAINCAALPENLVESELFGHERGAFTGADRAHKGAFERASNGTLFLDEVGELPPSAQAKLLRVLETRQVTRVGGERSIDVNARVVAATNRDLENEIAEKRFRPDLYYRLNVHVIAVVPLRNRLSDVAELSAHFLASICDRMGVRRKRLSDDALDALMSYDWRRNNVRELRNVIERMIIAADGDVIPSSAVPADVRGSGESKSTATTFHEQKAEAERRIIIAALERNDWHITNTARDLGLADHASLLKIMRRHGLKQR